MAEKSLYSSCIRPVLETNTTPWAACAQPLAPARSRAMTESCSAGSLTLFSEFHTDSNQTVKDLCSLLCPYLDATQCAAAPRRTYVDPPRVLSLRPSNAPAIPELRLRPALWHTTIGFCPSCPGRCKTSFPTVILPALPVSPRKPSILSKGHGPSQGGTERD